MTAFALFSLEPPVKWQAGLEGNRAFFFSCCKCGQKDAEIAGISARNVPQPTFTDLAILGDGPGEYRPAMYCVACYPAVLEEGKRRAAEPVIPEDASDLPFAGR